MRKTLVILSVCVSIYCNAQDRMVHVSFGPSIPVGDFKSATGGAAKTGAVFDLGFVYKFKSKAIGIAALLRGQAFAFDTQNTNATVTTWSTSSILVGPTWTLPLSSKIFFQPKVMVGFTAASSPAITETSGSFTVTQPSSSSIAFSQVLGGNFRFDTGKKISLLLNVDYFDTDPKFTLTASSSTISQTKTTDQKMNSINICAGLGYRF